MQDSRRLLVAALVLVIGLVAALAIPPGTCPHGELIGSERAGTYTCRISYDVFVAARSLIVLTYVVGIGSAVTAGALALSVLLRRRRGSMMVG